MFNVNWHTMIRHLLPPFMRKETIIAWLQSVFAALQTNYDQFIASRTKTLDDISINSQIIMLEYWLNKKFNNGLSGIWISDSITIDAQFLFNRLEIETPVYLFNTAEAEDPYYLYTNSEYISQIDFIINVPNSLIFNENEMKAFVNVYKLGGKKYIIQTY